MKRSPWVVVREADFRELTNLATGERRLFLVIESCIGGVWRTDRIPAG